MDELGPAAIEISDLTKRYGNFTAVDRLSLTVKRCEIFGPGHHRLIKIVIR